MTDTATATLREAALAAHAEKLARAAERRRAEYDEFRAEWSRWVIQETSACARAVEEVLGRDHGARAHLDPPDPPAFPVKLPPAVAGDHAWTVTVDELTFTWPSRGGPELLYEYEQPLGVGGRLRRLVAIRSLADLGDAIADAEDHEGEGTRT